MSHQLPSAADAQEFASTSTAISPAMAEVSAEVRGLLGSLTALQQTLAAACGASPEVAAPPPAEPDRCEPAAWAELSARMQPALDWGLQVADQWKERTRLQVRRSFQVLDQPLKMQMAAALEQDSARSRLRCAPPAGKHRVFGVDPEASEEGAAAAAAFDANIFDDRDFYSQLLREVLSGSGGAGGAGGVGRELRSEGKKAAKRRAAAEVERRASKGRKIRYVAVEKLQNFVAPRKREVEEDVGGLPTNAVDAMLKALFGRSK